MTTVDPFAFLAFALLVVGLLVGVLFWRSERKTRELLETRGPDPAVLLLQQQIESMRGQVSQALQGNLQLLQEQVGQVLGQVNERLRENADALQKSSQTLGDRLDSAARVLGEVQRSLGGLGEATQRVF